jgi:hypothetical protein
VSRAALSNRKKVRGWKTQLRRVERWRSRHLTPDWSHFDRFGYDYCKIQIDPWNRLIEREPPIWLGRQMVHGLLDIHEAWAKAIPDAPYLKVWLNWPSLTESQVVLAGPSRLDWYASMFRPVADLEGKTVKGFPPQFGPALLGRLHGWDWQECLDEYDVDPADLPAGWLASRPHSSVPLSDGSTRTLVEQGRVWVGTRRETA